MSANTITENIWVMVHNSSCAVLSSTNCTVLDVLH